MILRRPGGGRGFRSRADQRQPGFRSLQVPHRAAAKHRAVARVLPQRRVHAARRCHPAPSRRRTSPPAATIRVAAGVDRDLADAARTDRAGAGEARSAGFASPINLSRQEFRRPGRVRQGRVAGQTSETENLCRLVPDSVPSGLPVLKFQGCQVVVKHHVLERGPRRRRTVRTALSRQPAAPAERLPVLDLAIASPFPADSGLSPEVTFPAGSGPNGR